MDLLNLAQRIRATRIKQRMTVEQLAKKSGFSKAFISRLENFRISPSLKALNKITFALGITMADIFTDDMASPEYVFGNISAGEKIDRDNGKKFGINYFSLSFKKIDRNLDPFIIEYKSSSKFRDFLSHENDEFFLLLEGIIDFYIGDMQNCRRMIAGDTLYISKNIPHTVRLAEGATFAKALAVYSNS